MSSSWLPTRDGLALALANRRFRGLIVWIVGVLVTCEYLWVTLVVPLRAPVARATDLRLVYLPASRALETGRDPYSIACAHSAACVQGVTEASSLQPPVVTWLMQPLTHLDFTWALAAFLVVSQLAVIAFLLLSWAALAIRDGHLRVLLVVATLAFPPLFVEVEAANLQPWLLGLSALWLLGVMRDRGLPAGAGAGFATALKVTPLPNLAMLAWSRRWRAFAFGIGATVLLWAVGAPQLLGEYLFKVLPGANGGTGYVMDVAPLGTVERLLNPRSLYVEFGAAPQARTAALVIAVLVVAISFAVVRFKALKGRAAAADAALVVAATPLVLGYVRPGHLLLDLLPMFVLVAAAVQMRAWRFAWMAGIAWLLMGPAYLRWTNVWQPIDPGITRAGAELPLAGAVLIWVACLLLASRLRATPRRSVSSDWQDGRIGATRI